ncbi:hypothetical protein K501DRAFT_224544 [Backusella circina FSU 941]|nr:hypothetical protein K501DRAFT_224544 [Backusella circina FSU 941]
MTNEVTEEIRAEWMHFCIILLDKTPEIKTEHAQLYLDVIKLASIDSFPEVQKLSAKTLTLFAENQPKMTDYSCDKCIELIKPLLVHKHAPIRVLGIKTVEAVALASPKGLHLLFEYDESHDRQAIIPSLVFDTSALVRDHLFKMMGRLMCQWEPRERYQNGDRVLPILFSGVFDELPSVQSTCRDSLDYVGSICAQDLYEAGVISHIPSNQQEKETLGLKHIVHMCYEECLTHLLDGSTDFIVVKQLTGLESLMYFLKYSGVDDLVNSIKKLLSHLIKVYVNGYHEQVIKDKIFATISLLSSQLPTPDLYLDVLLPRLESSYLKFEKNGYPGAVTVMVVITFLDQFIVSSLTVLQPAVMERIAFVLKKTHMKDYLNDLDENSREYLDHLNSIVKV